MPLKFTYVVKRSDDVHIIDETRDGTMWVHGELDELDVPDDYRVTEWNDEVWMLQKSHPDLDVLAAQPDDEVYVAYRSQRSNNLIERDCIVEDIPGSESGDVRLVAMRDPDTADDPWEMSRVVVSENLNADSYSYVPREDKFEHNSYVQFYYRRNSRLGNVYAFEIK